MFTEHGSVHNSVQSALFVLVHVITAVLWDSTLIFIPILSVRKLVR